METVAREAGVTKPVLYDHFASKEELYRALIEEDAAALEARVRAALAARTGNRERIRASFQAYYDFVDEHAEGFRLVMQEQASPVALSPVREVREHIIRAVAELIGRQSHGKVTGTDAEMVAVGVIALVEAGAQRDPGGPRSERERQVDILVRLAWRGITGVTQA